MRRIVVLVVLACSCSACGTFSVGFYPERQGWRRTITSEDVRVDTGSPEPQIKTSWATRFGIGG